MFKLLDRRNQAELQWLQDPSEVNENNLCNVRRKLVGYLKDKINELESNSKNKITRDLCRVINEFKKRYKPKTDLVEDESGDLLADPHTVLIGWKNCFCQLLKCTWGG
jgi:hypothetical protein